MEKSEYKTLIAKNIKFLRQKEKLTQSDFAKLFDKTRDNIMSYERGFEPKLDFVKAVSEHFKVSITSLLNCDLKTLGEKEWYAERYLMNNYQVGELQKELQEKEEEINDLRKQLQASRYETGDSPTKLTPYRPKSGREPIPFYDVAMLAGLGSTFNDQTIHPDDYLDVPDFSGCVAFRASSDSMEELIKNNAILFATKVEDWVDELEFGQIYAVIMKDGRRFLKYVRKSADTQKFLLVSYNKIYDDFEVKKEKILDIWLIHGYINVLVNFRLSL